MQKINSSKTFILGNCPHCNKDFYVELEELPIEVKKIYTPAEIVTIKEDLKNKIELISTLPEIYFMDPIEEKDIFLSIDNENNIIDEEDANNMLEEIKKKHEKTK